MRLLVALISPISTKRVCGRWHTQPTSSMQYTPAYVDKAYLKTTPSCPLPFTRSWSLNDRWIVRYCIVPIGMDGTIWPWSKGAADASMKKERF